MFNNLLHSLTSPAVGFLLKLFAGLTTAAFGILGVGVKTREDDGRLNQKGWIALIGILVGGILAVGTSVYEFASGQEKERADRRRSERLLLSVQSGVYPLRQIMASFELTLADDFEGATAYRQALRTEISKNRDCKIPKAPFECSGVDEHGKPYEYRIYASSVLFPKTHSPVRDVLDSLYIYVTLFRQLPQEQARKETWRRPKFLGRFFIDWRQKLPNYAWLAYDFQHDTLNFGAEHYQLTDDSVLQAGVYSLVEFFPGVIGASPNLNDEAVCNGSAISKEACLKKIAAIYKGLALRELTLAFPYPKKIRLSEGQATSCHSENRQLLLLHLPSDVEAIDSLGNIENFKPDPSPQQTCDDLEAESQG